MRGFIGHDWHNLGGQGHSGIDGLGINIRLEETSEFPPSNHKLFTKGSHNYLKGSVTFGDHCRCNNPNCFL